MKQKFQTALRLIYPPRCLCCGDMVESEFGLCGPCWRDTPFITGLTCDRCGTPLIGDSDVAEFCDDCLTIERPWARGRAVFLYEGNARKMTLALKHGDRQEIARGAGVWLAQAGRDLFADNPILAPVPLHWTRLISRRFNQAAVLSHAVARVAGLNCCPDLLLRTRRTISTKGMSQEARFAQMQNAITISRARANRVAGRSVVLIDDVMTSGATLSAAADACWAAGACDVSTLVLARVAKAP